MLKHMKSIDKLDDENVEVLVYVIVQNPPRNNSHLDEVRSETKKDRRLQVLANVINEGWPGH